MEQVTQWMQTIFGEAWRLMCSVTVPGLGISAAQFAVGFFVIKWSLNLLSLVTGFHSNAYSVSENLRPSMERASAYRRAYIFAQTGPVTRHGFMR